MGKKFIVSEYYYDYPYNGYPPLVCIKKRLFWKCYIIVLEVGILQENDVEHNDSLYKDADRICNLLNVLVK